MMFNQYPYINVNDLNLDYILKQIKVMMNEVTNFVSINAIKYADPIQWDITRQYEKNTVVIDPVTGTAYISVAPVPAGVALTRPEYWTVVFDLGSFVTRAAQNFTSHYEESTTLTATFPTSMGGWLVWGDVLYKAKTNITAGDTYVVDGNIEHFTIEDLYNAYLNTIANILAIVGDLADLTTSDTSSIVNAINSVLSDVNATIGDLADLTTSDITDIVHAINSVLNDLNLTIGDLSNLTTSDTSDIVNAINSVLADMHTAIASVTTTINEHNPVNVLDLGVVGDGVTDDTTALSDCIANYDWLFIPQGATIRITSAITINRPMKIEGAGNWGSKIVSDTGAIFNITGRGVTLRNLELSSADASISAALVDIGVGQGTIENCHFDTYYNGLRFNNSSFMNITNCLFEHGYNAAGAGVVIGEVHVCTGLVFDGVRIWGDDNNHPNYGVLIKHGDGIDFTCCQFNRLRVPFELSPASTKLIHRITCTQTIFDVCDNPVTLYSKNGDGSDILNVNFEQCWFLMASATNRPLVMIDATDTVKDCNFIDCFFDYGTFGFYIDCDVENLIIDNCTFYNTKDTCIYIKSQPTAIISNIIVGAGFGSPAYNPLNGMFIQGTSYANRKIFIDNFVCNVATNNDFSCEVLQNIFVGNINVTKSNNRNIGTTPYRPYNAPDGRIYFDTSVNKPVFMINGIFRTWDKAGATADRPNPATLGDSYFDTTLNKPIWFNGSVWVDATGANV